MSLGPSEPKPSLDDANKFLIEEYKTLRDEITRTAGFHASAVRYNLIFAVLSFIFIAKHIIDRSDVIYIGFLYAGMTLVFIWTGCLITFLDQSTIKIGKFLKEIEEELLKENAGRLGWQKLCVDGDGFKGKRLFQSLFFLTPSLICFALISIYIYINIFTKYRC